MRNKNSKKTILIAVLIVIILSFSIVAAAQKKDITWFSIFDGSSYKIRLGDTAKKLEKSKDAIYLSMDNLKTMLAEKYKTSEVYIDSMDEKFMPDNNGKITLPLGDEKTYSLGRVYYSGDKGWSVNRIELVLDDSKFLSISDISGYDSLLDNAIPDFHSRLVNKDNTLPDGYNNENLVVIKGVQAIIGSKGMKLDRVTLEALKTMLDKAAADVVKGFVLNSTYRSYAEQKNLFDYRFNERKASGAADPYAEASKVVAYPGTSEHQTGMALDILSLEYPKGSVFNKSKEYAWLRDNSWDYGFIPRYPEDKIEKTQISFEPWHYRYIGRPLSLYAKQNNYCLEEVVEKLQKDNFVAFNSSNEDKYIFMLAKKGQGLRIETGIRLNYSLIELTEQDNLIIIEK